jgi:maleylacetate reductase
MDISTPLSLPPGLHRYSRMERVHWGRAAEDVLRDELSLFGSRRVFLVSNRSVAGSEAFARVRGAVADRIAGAYVAMRAHTPRECVVEAAAAARSAEADLLLALGGGSVIDGTKAVALCLRHGIVSSEGLDAYAGSKPPDLGREPADAQRWIRNIAIPTTLSGAEFASSAGVTDVARKMKQPFVDPMQMPVAVILDPAMTLSAPLDLLRSTAMKAIDHAAERMTSAAANPYSDAVSALALQMLGEGARGLDAAPGDLALRSKLQYGMFMSLCGSASGVAVNVSHAIGHVLGGHAGVPHGQTTGVTLPSVLAWNHDETLVAQGRIAAMLGGSGDDAGAVIADLARSLGLPTRLRDVGVAQSSLDAIADKTLHEHLLKNSRKAVARADVLAILQRAW